MLVRVVKYVLANPASAELPVREGIEWDKQIKVGKIDGKVFAAQAVDLAGDGKLDLFVAAEKGDRLYQLERQEESLRGYHGEIRPDLHQPGLRLGRLQRRRAGRSGELGRQRPVDPLAERRGDLQQPRLSAPARR